MVLLSRTLPRLSTPAFSRAFTSASRSGAASSASSLGARRGGYGSLASTVSPALRQKPFLRTHALPAIYSRGYADKREKVKVLLVLYDGMLLRHVSIDVLKLVLTICRWKARRGGMLMSCIVV